MEEINQAAVERFVANSQPNLTQLIVAVGALCSLAFAACVIGVIVSCL